MTHKLKALQNSKIWKKSCALNLSRYSRQDHLTLTLLSGRRTYAETMCPPHLTQRNKCWNSSRWIRSCIFAQWTSKQGSPRICGTSRTSTRSQYGLWKKRPATYCAQTRRETPKVATIKSLCDDDSDAESPRLAWRHWREHDSSVQQVAVQKARGMQTDMTTITDHPMIP